MTWATPTPTSPSAGDPATKFGMAIGSGAKEPSGTITRFGACPNALRTSPPISTPSEAIPEIICRRLGRNGISRNRSLSVIGTGFISYLRSSAGAHFRSFGKHRRKIFPFVEIGRRQIIRLAFDNRAQGALLIDAKIRRGRRPFRNRHPFQRAVAL